MHPAMLSLLALVVAAPAAAQVCADATADGAVTVSDGVRVLRAAAGLEDVCPASACDLDGNGRITLTDGVGTLRVAAGLSATVQCPSAAAIPDAPRPNREAEEAALCASGELVASDALYETFRRDLAGIRTEFGASIPDVNEIYFVPRWVVTDLVLVVTAAGVEAIRNGEAHGLDSLNARYHLERMDTGMLDSLSAVVLEFKGRLHPLRLAEIYRSSLDMLRSAGPNSLVGDSSRVYPWASGEERRYLFRKAWGDCPAGCISSRFWYFRVIDARIEYVGTWEMGTGAEPAWWPEARVTRERYCVSGDGSDRRPDLGGGQTPLERGQPPPRPADAPPGAPVRDRATSAPAG